MGRINCILVLVLFVITGRAQQNLVLNEGAENYSSCPTGLGQTNLLFDVSNPNLNTPDFFHTCSTTSWPNQVNIPGNFWGYQNTLNGNGYVGIGMYFNGNNVRDYITFELSDTLIISKKYDVKFHFSLGDSVKYSTDKLGVYLHINQIFQNDIAYLPYQPQIENQTGNFITDRTNWLKIEGEYIAGGGEKYITIGNFYPDSLTDTIALNNDPISSANKFGTYFYLDNISVTEIIDTTDTVQPIDSTIFNINIFPNPNNAEFSLNYNLEDFENGVFKIYNAIGQIVFEEKLLQNNGVRNLQLRLSSGAYVWQVESGEAVLKREKMVVTK